MEIVKPLNENDIDPILLEKIQFFKGPLGVIPSSVKTMSYHPKIADAFTLVSIKCLPFICCLISVYLFLTSPAYSANWVEVEVGEDSGDTYLWPYFYSASRFVDGASIKKSSEGITYVELVNAKKAISSNVSSLVVSKKSKCDGEKVVWQNFYIYKSAMGLGTPIMRLNPNEAQELKKGGAGALTDAFACELAKLK